MRHRAHEAVALHGKRRLVGDAAGERGSHGHHGRPCLDRAAREVCPHATLAVLDPRHRRAEHHGVAQAFREPARERLRSALDEGRLRAGEHRRDAAARAEVEERVQ